MPLTEWVVCDEKECIGPPFYVLGRECWHIEKPRVNGWGVGLLCGAYLTEAYGGDLNDVTASQIRVCRSCQRIENRS